MTRSPMTGKLIISGHRPYGQRVSEQAKRAGRDAEKVRGAGRPSWYDFQRRNLVPFEFEKEPKVNGAAGKVSNQMASNNRLSVLLFARERLACVFILCRGIRLPLFDCGPASVGVPLVLHDGIFSQTLRERLAVTFVCGEVGGDLFWQVERFRCLFHIHVLSCWCIFFLPSQTVGIVPCILCFHGTTR